MGGYDSDHPETSPEESVPGSHWSEQLPTTVQHSIFGQNAHVGDGSHIVSGSQEMDYLNPLNLDSGADLGWK